MSARARHAERTVHIGADAKDVFAFVDDHRNLAAHMGEKSVMMAGSKLTTEIDGIHAQDIGDHIRMNGRVMGVRLALDEVVTERDAPTHKAWETVGSPKLLVVGPYKMALDVSPARDGSILRVGIDYALPDRNRWIGRLFGRAYARWCVRKMSGDVETHFAQ